MPNTEENLEQTEAVVMQILTNDPSDPIQIAGYPVRVVFQRPKLADKYKARAWSMKKLKELGISRDDEEMNIYFTYWGVLNGYVRRLLVEDEAGSIRMEGKRYRDYTYDPASDLDYGSLFEKYVVEEVYNKGQNDEPFVWAVITAQLEWLSPTTELQEDNVKNS